VRGGIGANVSKIDVGPPYFGIDLMGLTADDRYYLYSTELESGGLYDISGNPYDFRIISDMELVREYHERLYRHLDEKGIHIKKALE
jgi:hypothetical protein